MSCCCDQHDLLARLDQSGEDEDLFKEILSGCVEQGDEFALYLDACWGGADEDSNSFITKLQSLVKRHNPWALAELGLHYTFVHASDQERQKGKEYLKRAALFGEPRAQYYHAYGLRRVGEAPQLVERLLRASAQQGYERAQDDLERSL